MHRAPYGVHLLLRHTRILASASYVHAHAFCAGGLLRVSPDFMVVALGLPVPRFPGNPLDPPLRSRFQALGDGGGGG